MRISTLLVAAAAVAAMSGAALAQPPAGGGGGGRGPALTPEQLETAFKAGDANKDGKLDKAELGKALDARTAAIAAAAGGAAGPGRGPMTPEQLDANFMRYDANMDGSVSLAEFQMPPGRGGGGGGRGGPGGGGGGGRGPGG